MIQSKFTRSHKHENWKLHGISSVLSIVLLAFGTVVLVSSLIFLLFNLGKSDSLVGLMIPILIFGIILMVISQLIPQNGSTLFQKNRTKRSRSKFQ